MDEARRLRRRMLERQRHAKKYVDVGKRGKRGLSERDLRVTELDNNKFLIALRRESARQ